MKHHSKVPEINVNELRFMYEVGKGKFGKVFCASWSPSSSKSSKIVAVKWLKQNDVDESSFEDFMKEIEVAAQLPPHTNVLQIKGYCITPYALVTEFINGGSVETAVSIVHPKSIRSTLYIIDVVQILLDTACGISHLHMANIVHRDVAARNLLIENEEIPEYNNDNKSIQRRHSTRRNNDGTRHKRSKANKRISRIGPISRTKRKAIMKDRNLKNMKGEEVAQEEEEDEVVDDEHDEKSKLHYNVKHRSIQRPKSAADVHHHNDRLSLSAHNSSNSSSSSNANIKRRVIVCDFGLSRITQSADDGAYTINHLGPLKWMSPESIRNQVYNSKTDVYSYGITMWEILTGIPPYPNHKVLSLAVEVCQKCIRPKILEWFPKQLSVLMQRCWQEIPAYRPSLYDIIQELTQYRTYLQFNHLKIPLVTVQVKDIYPAEEPLRNLSQLIIELDVDDKLLYAKLLIPKLKKVIEENTHQIKYSDSSKSSLLKPMPSSTNNELTIIGGQSTTEDLNINKKSLFV